MGLRDEYERVILVVARQEVKAGSHYLMGGKGQIPQDVVKPEQATSNVVCFYPDVTSRRNDQIYNTAFIKYTQTAGEGKEGKPGFYLCLGRCAVAGVSTLSKGDVAHPENHKGFRWPRSAFHPQGVKENYMRLVNCRHRAFSPAAQETCAKTPKSLQSRRSITEGERYQEEDYIWGESCRGKRHFDCSGFVNYCLGRVLVFKGKKPWYSIENLATRALTDDVTGKPLRAGDLGIRDNNGHIGFASGGGTWIHAEWPFSGVTENSAGSGFSQVVRFNDRFWELISSVVTPSTEEEQLTGTR